MVASQTALCYAPLLQIHSLLTTASSTQSDLAFLPESVSSDSLQVFNTALSSLQKGVWLYGAAAGLYDVCMINASVMVQLHTYELHGMAVQAHSQRSLKIRLKLPGVFQQRASRLSPKPVAAPMSGKQIKGTLLQARAEETMSLVKLLLPLLSACHSRLPLFEVVQHKHD